MIETEELKGKISSDNQIQGVSTVVSGPQGKDGLSAYEVAVKNGYIGTEEEWLINLKGEKGDQGKQGIQGEKGDPTATIEINQVITGEAGTNAKIENVGTDVNLKLNITIPQGDKGKQGETGADGYTPIKGTDYFTEAEIQQIKSDILADVSSFDLEVVTTLPTENIKEKTIYLVPNSKQAENNIYDEYIYVNNNWEIVGSTAIDPENLKDSVPIGAIIEYDGDTVPDGYEEVEENEIIVSPTEPTGNNRKKVWMQKGKNRFNSYLVTFTDNSCKHSIESSNKVILTSTNVWARTQCKISNLKPNTIYIISSLISNPNSNYVGLYESETNRNLSSDTNWKSTLVITSDSDGVATFTMWANWTSTSNTNSVTFDEIQIEQGSTLNEYEEYIEPKIYVKNGNDVYEEFMKKDEGEVYSTEEVRIGTWIDGKPLYRKVYDGIAISSNETIIASISGIDVKMIYGWLVKTSVGFTQSFGSYSAMDSTSTSRVFYASPYIKVQAGADYQTGTVTARVIVEYTKTTD